MKRLIVALAVFGIVLSGAASAFAALTPGATYTIEVYKLTSTGTTTLYSSTTATADANGKLTFTLTVIPTKTDCNFIVFTLKDANGTVVRRGFAPAPASGATNLTGINTLSTPQTECLLEAASAAGSDDPIMISYALMLLRSPSATTADANKLAQIGKSAIIGSGSDGFEPFLLANGVSAQMLSDFKGYLIYNPTSGKKTLADFTAGFKTAVDTADATTATQEMQKAGGLVAEIFIDASQAAGFDFGLILAANDAAGEVAGNSTNMALMGSMTATVQSSIQEALSSFNKKIKTIKVKSEYTKALTTLNSTESQLTRFNEAVAIMIAANRKVDSDYAEYFMDPNTYVTTHNTTHAAVQALISQAFNDAFTAFQTAIASTDDEITAMKTAVTTGLNMNQSYLPNDFGKYYDFTGTQKNWPIPQTVMVTWLATHPITYTQQDRDTLAVPSQMSWLGSCSVQGQNTYSQQGCTAAGGTWTPGRRDYTNMSPSATFNAYLALTEDISIIENTRYAIYSGGQQPTKAQERQAKLDFTNRMTARAAKIGGTGITDAQKDAIVKLCMQPSMD